MRRPGQHAVIATFSPVDDRTRAVLRRGSPLSSVVRFTGTDMAPASLLMDAYRQDDNLVRIELLAHPERTKQLPEGIGFELVAGETLLGNGRILPCAWKTEGAKAKQPSRRKQAMNIRQIAGVGFNYRERPRGEVNCVARLYHLLQDRENLGKFLEMTGYPEAEEIVEDEFGIFLEYAYLRDLWEHLKQDADGNQQKKQMIVSVVGTALPDAVSQPSIKSFNEYFGAGKSRKPSAEHIEGPQNWQLHRIKDLDKIDNASLLDLCKFKWSFNARPDMVIHISKDAAVCIEAKLLSGESKYPGGGPLRKIFKKRNLPCVSQTALQEYLMKDLLGLRTHFVYVTESGSPPKSTSYTPISWRKIFYTLRGSG